MRLLQCSCIVILLLVLASCSGSQPSLNGELEPQNTSRYSVLVYSHTAGFRHDSIEDGVALVKALGEEHNFEVDATEDSLFFVSNDLSTYAAIVFMNTNRNVLDESGQAAFEKYIQQGGGFVGVHSAAATEYDWEWYGQLVGAWFKDHPKPQDATVVVADQTHPSTAHLPKEWEHFDEWYNYRVNPRSEVHVLATVPESSYEGGSMGHDHPIAWAHEFDGGRSWYTGLGHTKEVYAEPLFQQHLLGGIEWAAGQVEGDVHVTRAASYKKKVLMDEVTDPMEIAIAEDGRVFLAERAGAIKVWDPVTEETTLAGWIPVYMIIEDGLLGLTLDPDFSENGWMYVFYAPDNGGPSRLSRFTVEGNSIHMESEKILLEIPVQRNDCCHAGGSLAFDATGNLYVSTGDNTNPYDREGSPIDERPGNHKADAQRSSGNTNDLRGKILRIHPEPDGTYSIPEGNLFEADSLHRPEIYTMGHRNPFRIAVDSKTGWLYWGDVGNGDAPNARGGWGWDEFNLARGPGNFGWPYFTGNNEAYKDFDYETQVIGDPFDAASPINDSPNNTGAKELPPAEPAWIWYTYGSSEDFPDLGAGGINPMAGPVYRKPETPAPYALPDYYEGKPIIYEWMRNWVMEVDTDGEGNVLEISPFLPGMEFVRPIDMEIGPDGALYIAEWGDAFWGSNADAQVVRVEYRGNGQMPMMKDTMVRERAEAPEVNIYAPANGGFFKFDESQPFTVSVSNIGDGPLRSENLDVTVYSGFDTHKLPLKEIEGGAGLFSVSKAFKHTPDIHMVDRFAEVEACYTNEEGVKGCNKVKLQPTHKEAEHVMAYDKARKFTHGTHPASEMYPVTALITMQLSAEARLLYSPLNLEKVSSVTLRYKQHGNGTLVLYSDKVRKLAQIDLDTIEVTEVAQIKQIMEADEAVSHDEALDVSDLDRSAYENWAEVTVPIHASKKDQGLTLVLKSEDKGMVLELDWLRFNLK